MIFLPRRLLAAFILLAWAHAALGEDDYQAGREAYAAGQFAEAARIWLPLAVAGDLRAQFAVGTLYDEGSGVSQDADHSAYWFARAAEQGLPAAQFNLGNAYRHGRGLSQDDVKAVHWWLRAAEQGFPRAQFNLGTQYFFGRGVAKDEAEALMWYQRAAANGHQRAQQIIAEVQTSAGAKATAAALPGIHGADWLLASDPRHYTLQLAALSELERVPRFIHQHQLNGELAYFTFLREGTRYFALLKGIYPDRSSARQAIEALPPEIREASAWIRPVAEIQELIRANPRE